jgi:hypothetical protein
VRPAEHYIILSFVAGITIKELSNGQFEHTGGELVWLSSAMENPKVSQSKKDDRAWDFARALESGKVNCAVSLHVGHQHSHSLFQQAWRGRCR